MVANVVLALILMQVLSHVGIALATACSAWMNAIILWVILHRRGNFMQMHAYGTAAFGQLPYRW